MSTKQNRSAVAGLGELVRSRKAVLFDLFHTITVPDPPAPGLLSTAQILGVDPQAWEEQVFRLSRERLVGAVTDPCDVIRAMAWAIDPSIPERTIRRAAENRLKRFEATLLAIPQANCGVLESLRASGKLLCLCSNADRCEIPAWPRSPAARHFHAAVFSCDVGYAKPEPEIYLRCLEALGVAARDAFFVGDGSCDELRGAREVGLTTVMMAGVARRHWPAQIATRMRHADYVVEGLAELVA